MKRIKGLDDDNLEFGYCPVCKRKTLILKRWLSPWRYCIICGKSFASSPGGYIMAKEEKDAKS